MRPEVGLELQGRYQLVERIAVGGMGEVWKATDLRSGRAVAAKILRHELTGDEVFLSRLRAEARNSRGLRHPNLAVVLDSGERDGSGWIIMELVRGRALSDIITEQGTMQPADILPVLAQVARALQVVHDSGVVHRDVKPSNILINREGMAKLTDFGISMGVHQRPLTAAGMVMGTAQYLPPEQAMGNMATPAGDLYALGIIGYEALVGRRPFTGSTQVDIAFAHVNQQVPPMPDSVPPEVCEIVMQLLEKKPAARPGSAREVARRLDRIVINLPPESWDPSQAPTWTATGRPMDGADDAVPAADQPTRRSRRLAAAASVPSSPPPDSMAWPAPRSRATSGTRAIPAVGRARTALAARPADSATGRHSTDRGLLGLRLATWSWIILAVVAALILALCLGTLAGAHAVPGDGVLTPATPPKEAL